MREDKIRVFQGRARRKKTDNWLGRRNFGNYAVIEFRTFFLLINLFVFFFLPWYIQINSFNKTNQTRSLQIKDDIRKGHKKIIFENFGRNINTGKESRWIEERNRKNLV